MSSWFPDSRARLTVRIPTFLLPPAAMCLLLSASARADEWVIDRSVSANAGYNDNINMHPSDASAATNLTLRPSLSLSNRTETREASVNLAATVNRYVERPEYNTIDHRASLSLKWATELNQWSLALASVRDSTLTSELATTGVVLARRQRTLMSVQASWQRSLTENTSASAALSLASARYEPAPGLVDYNDKSLSAGLRHVLSERSSVGASLSTREYRTAAGDVKSRANAASISGQLRYSERLQFSLDAGKDRTRTDLQVNGLSITSAVRGTTFNGAASYQLERGSLSASIGRNLSASGTGSLLRSDQASIDYVRRFSETLEFGFGAGVVRSRFLDNAAGETRFTRLSPSLQWQLDPMISLSFGVTHSTQISAGQLQPARSNMVFVGLNYGFRPLSVSR